MFACVNGITERLPRPPPTSDRSKAGADVIGGSAFASCAPFHGSNTVAPLKRLLRKKQMHSPSPFPRFKHRGPIEAALLALRSRSLALFPRFKHRGPIEVRQLVQLADERVLSTAAGGVHERIAGDRS